MLLQEIASKLIIPPLKGLLAHILSDKGFSQRRIARLMGITQPQVHKYLNKPKEYYYQLLTSHGFNLSKINTYLNIIAYTAMKEDQVKLVLLMSSVVDELAIDYFCRTKKEAQNYCRGKLFVDPYIEYYKAFLSRLITTYDIYNLIPEVGSNIVYAPEKPSNIGDIIGLTGRIIRTAGSVEVVGEPIYGGSRHLSKVLLIASRHNPELHSAMNIVYDKLLFEKLRAKYKSIECGPHESMDDFWNCLEEKLREKPCVIGDRGGFGLEPVIYLLARDLEDLEDIIRYLLEK